MAVTVNWKKSEQKKIYFSDLQIGDTFVIDTSRAHNTLYMKVVGGYRNLIGDKPLALEITTGKVFEPTNSPVKLVNVEITAG